MKRMRTSNGSAMVKVVKHLARADLGFLQLLSVLSSVRHDQKFIDDKSKLEVQLSG